MQVATKLVHRNINSGEMVMRTGYRTRHKIIEAHHLRDHLLVIVPRGLETPMDCPPDLLQQMRGGVDRVGSVNLQTPHEEGHHHHEAPHLEVRGLM